MSTDRSDQEEVGAGDSQNGVSGAVRCERATKLESRDDPTLLYHVYLHDLLSRLVSRIASNSSGW